MSRPSPAGIDWDTWWTQQEPAGVVDFANWPYYIDRRRDNSHPSLDRFTSGTGIRVNYSRPIRGNARFLEKVEPDLQAGRPIGYDLIVITNGPELSRLMESGWLVPLDHFSLGHFHEQASDLVRDPPWDPGNRYTVAWQSGLTGLGFRPEAVEAIGRKPESFQDLWNPGLKGKVGMMSDLLELGSVGLLADGIDPASSSPSQWGDAAQLLQLQHDTVRPRYYDQGYLDALMRGDTWLSLAWSGDIFQANQLGHPELRFVVPDEGALFWTDNMMIPVGAEHPADALALMNFVYRPEIAAMIADWVWYMTPVPAARPIIAKEFGDSEVARSPLVFPGSELLGQLVTLGEAAAEGETNQTTRLLGSRIRHYYVFGSASEYAGWAQTFEPIIYS